ARRDAETFGEALGPRQIVALRRHDVVVHVIQQKLDQRVAGDGREGAVGAEVEQELGARGVPRLVAQLRRDLAGERRIARGPGAHGPASRSAASRRASAALPASAARYSWIRVSAWSAR